MVHLYKDWNRIESRFKKATVPLFLDYDGTLTPIVDHPDRAVLSEQMKNVLISLSNLPGIRMAVVSGRSLSDLKKRIGIKKIVYVGNHGLEIEGPHFKYTPPLPDSYARRLALLRIRLQRLVKSFPESELENKGYTLSLHYRRLNPLHITALLDEARRLAEPFRRSEAIGIRTGKMVLEIRPFVSWNKGSAVEWLLNRRKWMREGLSCQPVFIGDDATDEDAFQVIGPQGLGIRIGRARNSRARYYLRDHHEVFLFLHRILNMKGRRNG